MKTELVEDIACPICLEIPENKIFQCTNGHSYCGGCALSIEECPQRRIPLTRIRNRAMENLLDKIKFECTNKVFGFQLRTHRQDLSNHRILCKYGTNSKLRSSHDVANFENNTYLNHFKTVLKYLNEMFSQIKLRISEMRRDLNEIDRTKCATVFYHICIIAFIVVLTLVIEIYH